jgi:ArsR family transcriptional regulator, arsenate/arsenite/antimonite-responsive transcriptional repressor
MEQTDVVAALAALAQEHRLEAYRLLVQAGHKGLAAGEVATALGMAPNTLSFHLERLRQAGLVTFERHGRSLIYAARFDTMQALLGYLTDNCCGGHPEICRPAPCPPAKTASKARKVTVR